MTPGNRDIRAPLSIALLGTRGVPARYGGFETAVEEIGSRLAAGGHYVRVYARTQAEASSYRGMHIIYLPTLRFKVTETLVHTALSICHCLFAGADVAIVFNVANAPIARLLKLKRMPYAIHVDGIEWKRAKWGRVGRRYLRACERIAATSADALIADARAVQAYYEARYRSAARFIPYGAPESDGTVPQRVAELGVSPRAFHLVVARFEPENHIHDIVAGYRASGAQHPLVVIGASAYGSSYTRMICDAKGGDERVRLVGAVWDQELLDTAYANCTTYIHGHSVGGTNPSLLRAMGFGAMVIAKDVVFNREVLGKAGDYFTTHNSLAAHIQAAEANAGRCKYLRACARTRARALYRWNDVARDYEELCWDLREGSA